jgi:hypothetical protein
MRQTIYWHVAAASEPASYTWNFTANQNAVGGIVAYSGAATTSPIINGQANGSSNSINAPSVTTVAANSLVVGFFGIAASTTVRPAFGHARTSGGLDAGIGQVEGHDRDR